MAVERFTLQQFEEALPKSKDDGKPMWEYIGFDQGEEVFSVPVKPGVILLIRSSIDETGWCRGKGEDSIRITVASVPDLEPLCSRDCKVQHHVARTKNWRSNLLRVLREEFKVALLLGPCKCGKGTVRMYKVKKEGPNLDRLFAKCTYGPKKGDGGCGVFHWVDEVVKEKGATA